MKIAGVVISLLFFLSAMGSYAGADELSDLKEALEEQQQKLEELQEKLKALEEKKHLEEEEALEKIDIREHEELKKKVEEMEERRRLEEAASKEMEEILPRFGVNLGLFGDINYSTDSRERVSDTFSLGEIDLYSTAGYGGRLNFLFEMLIEFEEDETELDAERLWVGYTISDLLIIRAGKFHTALGYWNKTFHHGKHLFPTVDRPFFLRFEEDEGIIPAHIVGLELAGSADIGQLRAKYWLEVGNGPRIDGNRLNPNNFVDDDDAKQFAFRTALSTRSLPGLSLGLFTSHFSIDTTLTKGVDEHIYGLDLHYARAGLELVSEYFFFDNPKASADAFYVQLSQTFGLLTPFTRFEWLDVDSGDPYMSALAGGFDRSQFIAGLRYDIDLFHSSLKAQYRHDDERGGRDKDFDVFEAQWTLHF